MLNIAHRGASGHAPENTLTAFQLAVQMGAHMVEMDLRQSLDGELVVIHDRSLLRTTGKRRIVSRLPLKSLKALDAGSWFGGDYRGEPIPALGEVMNLFGMRVRLNVEIKKVLGSYRGMEKSLVGCLENNPYQGNILVSSRDTSILQRIKKLRHDVPIGYIFKRESPEKVVRKASRLRAVSIHGKARSLSEEHIRWAHSEGFKIYVYTINEEEAMRHWIALGVDGIITNYPDRLQTVLRAAGMCT